jgi:hypothetical protein
MGREEMQASRKEELCTSKDGFKLTSVAEFSNEEL